MHGTISNSILLANMGVSIKSTYTYHFASSLPSYANGYSTDYTETSGGSTSYQMDSSDFYDVTSVAESPVAAALTGIGAVGAVSFNYSTSSSSDINIWGLNTTLYELGTSKEIGGFGFQPPTYPWPAGLYSDLVITSSSLSIDRVVSHELNHTIGLLDVRDTALKNTDEKSTRFSIMSYDLHEGTGRLPTELQLYDIASIQALYGRAANNSGDTTYSSFADSSLSRMFSIWDSGGTDTIDASGQSDAALIDLRPGYFSSIGPGLSDVEIGFSSGQPTVIDAGQLNVSIAFGAYIEDAKGTTENDLIIGNLLSNTLWGGAGNDIIYAEGKNSAYDAGDGDYRQISDTATNNVEAAPTGIQDFVSDGWMQSDTLYGEGGNDYLMGGDGHDILYGGDDNDFLDSGKNIDPVTYDGDIDELYGDDGDDILILRGIGVAAEGGADNDQFWIVNTDGIETWHEIYDSEAGDSLYWNGYLLEGGDKIITEAESDGGFFYYRTGAIDSNGFRYEYHGDYDLLNITAPDGGIVSIYDFENGDFGIDVGDPMEFPDPNCTWVFNSSTQHWDLQTTYQLSSIAFDGLTDNWEDLPGYENAAANFGSNSLPTTWIEI